MLEPVLLAPRSAFEGRLQPAGPSGTPGVIVSERADLQIATVIARGGRDPVAARLRSAYGIDLPTGPSRIAMERLALVATGPRTWLATRDGGGPLAEEVQRELGETAAVSDQSDGYAVLRLSGMKVRATFEKGLSVDLHPRAFRSGDAAVTTCSHLGLIIWQVDDAPTYEVAVFRSLAAAFWHWLFDSAAEYGLHVAPSGRG